MCNLLLVTNLVLLLVQHDGSDNMDTAVKGTAVTWLVFAAALAQMKFIHVLYIGTQDDSLWAMVILSSVGTYITRLWHIGKPPPWTEIPTIVDAGLIVGWASYRMTSRNEHSWATRDIGGSIIRELRGYNDSNGQETLDNSGDVPQGPSDGYGDSPPASPALGGDSSSTSNTPNVSGDLQVTLNGSNRLAARTGRGRRDQPLLPMHTQDMHTQNIQMRDI